MSDPSSLFSQEVQDSFVEGVKPNRFSPSSISHVEE